MTDAHDHQLRDLFVAALEVPSREREAWLDRVCHDPAQRRELAELLSSHATLASESSPHSEPPGTALDIGTVVGPYRIEAFLAAGGTSSVYRATRVDDAGRAALKVIATAQLSTNARARIANEARIASSIRHPSVVRVVDQGEDCKAGIVFLAMDLVEGPSLDAILRQLAARGAVEPAERREIVRRCAEVAHGLAALHERGFLHRDVKPANVVLLGVDADTPLGSRAVLVDLGLARDLSPGVTHATRWATLAYAPPEVLTEAPLDASADVFGLGLTLHDLLAARLPEQRCMPVVRSPEPLRHVDPGVDTGLASVVAMATAPEPRWRYGDASLLAADLDGWLEGRRPRARRVNVLHRATRFARTHPRRAMRALLIGAGIVIGAALVAFGARQVAAGISAARAVDDAWTIGDLEHVARGLDTVPGWLRSDALPAATTDPALHGVLARIESSGSRSALIHAARFLERDGLAEHPVLARYLGRAVTTNPASAVPIVSRLFFERPDRTRADMATSAPLRAAVQDLMDSGCDIDLGLEALVGLGGCGDLESIDVMLRWIERHRDDVEDGAAVASTGAHTVDHVLRRMLLQRLDDRRDELDLDRIARRLDYALPAQLTINIVRRGQGKAPPNTAYDDRTEHDRLRLWASAGNPRLVGELLTNPFARLDRHKDSAKEVSFFNMCLDLGAVCTLYAKPDLTERVRKLVETEARAHGWNVEWAASKFEHGVRRSSDALEGFRTDFAPDPDTHLGNGLASSFGGSMRPPISAATAPAGVVASWTMLSTTFDGAGQRLSAELLDAQLARDELLPDLWYPRLPRGGASEIRLGFFAAGLPDRVATAEIRAQRNMRSMLPRSGKATLEVRIDGRLAGRLFLTNSSTEVHAVSLSTIDTTGQHVLSLRAGRDTNTPVRIYEVRILRRSPERRPPR